MTNDDIDEMNFELIKVSPEDNHSKRAKKY